MTAEGLGRYEIVEELGRGAMGVVYLAQDPALGRLVAVKALNGRHPEGQHPGAASILREARVAGALDHPNIVTVHDATDGEQPFIAMEYVQGTDLKEVLRPGQPLPHDFALRVTEQVASALDCAHAQGVVHRDVKPGNILITADETVKLTDFGIASTAADGEPNERLGTPHYVAPEQLRGEPVDGRGDVFALAVVTYEMLTGKRPFDHPDLKEVARRLAHEPFTPPHEHGAELPDAVIRVLRRALAKQPAQRFASAGDFARSLRAAFEDRQEAATRDLSDLLPEPPRPRRRPVLWAAAGMAALLAAASVWGFAHKSSERQPAAATPAAPPHRLEGAPLELVHEAEELRAAGDPITAERLLGLAQRMAPHRQEVRVRAAAVAVEAEAQRAELWRDGTVERLLVEAQKARQAGRYSQAIDLLRRAAEVDPDQPAVQELLRRVDRARARHAAARQAAEPPVVPVQPTLVAAPPPSAPPARPVADWSELRIDLFSQLPRGVVTLYANGEQILNQGFRFGKRSGLLRKPSGAGRLEARRRLSPGETEMRVYVTLPGRPAMARPLEAVLAPGATRVLRILVDGDGALSVQLD